MGKARVAGALSRRDISCPGDHDFTPTSPNVFLFAAFASLRFKLDSRAQRILGVFTIATPIHRGVRAILSTCSWYDRGENTPEEM
jgi:hypothetical protein